MDYARHFLPFVRPQSEPLPGQVPNSAGGYAWKVSDRDRLLRFLILGSEGGTYYIGEPALTRENARAAINCITADGPGTVEFVREVSLSGRAPSNEPALFVLALAMTVGDGATRRRVADVLPDVARTGYHLLRFVHYAHQFRGWGSALKRAVSRWYTEKDPEQLAYQLIKYRQRGGVSHADVLRLAHPQPPTPAHNALFRYVTHGTVDVPPVKGPGERRYDELSRDLLPPLVEDFERLCAAHTVGEVLRIVERNPAITWEMIPTEFLGAPEVWAALLPNLPMWALLRNLARMTASGLLTPHGKAAQTVADRVADATALRKARIHPVTVLSALSVYRKGHGERGRLNWTPVPLVLDALEAAFYRAFDNVEPTGRRWYLALDVSASMACSVFGLPGVSAAMASAAMAMVTARTEPQCYVAGFFHRMQPLHIGPQTTLNAAMKEAQKRNFGGTDCALPMLDALKRKIEADVFVVYTDSETWYGRIHPAEALRRYRQKTGINAKLIVCAMASNGFTIADPDDPGMLDVVGFDASVPAVMAMFARGEI